MTLADLAGDARLVVVAGPGGVGKTTSAAAIAVASAEAGLRTLVLTADPARRLADALGIVADPRGQPVPVGSLPLRAAMLDSEQAFAALLPQMVPDPAARRRIEQSPVYRRFSRSLARSHAYATLERLHEALLGAEAATLDRVVLDTPPMRGLLDLLDAPDALATFARSAAVDVFAGDGPSFFGWAARRTLGVLTGAELGASLAEFLAAFAPFRAGFSARARAIAEAQRAPSARTVLVTSGDPLRIADARSLGGALDARGVRCRAILGSGLLERSSPRWEPRAIDDTLARRHGAALALAHLHGRRARDRQEHGIVALASLARALDAPLWASPMLATEPTDVVALSELARRAQPIDQRTSR